MTDDALLSTPARSSALESSGWQEGRMDEQQGRGAGARLGQGAWEAPWLATGGHPVGANPFSPSEASGRPAMPDRPQATGHYGPGYGDRQQHFGNDVSTDGRAHAGHDEHHHHYQRLRAEHERQLDEDYAAYRQHRFGSEFERWRNGRQEAMAPRDEGALHSLGRAISETVTGSQEPDLQGQEHGGAAPSEDTSRHDRQHGGTERFFERS